jgi:hypothetical protein
MEFSMETAQHSESGSKVLRNLASWKFQCRIFGMFSVLTKIRHQTFTDPATSRKEF